MKKRTTLFALLLTGGLLISAAPLTPSELGTIKISVQEIDGATAGTLEVKERAYSVGNMYSVPLSADVYAAAINNQVVKIDGSNLSFIAGLEDTVVKLYTGKGDKNAVLAVDPNGFVLGSYDAYDYDTISALSVPTAPAGYTAGSFKYKGEEISTDTVINEDAVIKYEYTADIHANLDLVTIINGKTEFSYVGFDEVATVTSTAANFSHWLIGEQIVSYSKTYSFTMYADTIIREVVSDVAPVATPVINLYRDDIKNTDMNNIYAVGYELPAGYTLVETGMLFGDNPVIGAEGVSKKVARAISDKNEFAVRFTSTAKAQAYLIYKDEADDINVIYDAGNHVEQVVFNDENMGASTLDDDNLSSYYTNSLPVTRSTINGTIWGKKETACNSIKLGTSDKNEGIGYEYSRYITAINVSAKAWTKDDTDLYLNGNKIATSISDVSFNEFSLNDLYTNSAKITTDLTKSGDNRLLISYAEFVIAELDNTIYDVLAEGDDNGTITADITGGVIGTEVTLTITPAEGYRLATLTNNDEDIISSYNAALGTATIRISKDGNIVMGTFEKIPSYTVTVSPTENGTIVPSITTGLEGSEVTLTITPAEGYRLATLTNNGTNIKNSYNAISGTAVIVIAKDGNLITGTFESDATPSEVKVSISSDEFTGGYVSAEHKITSDSTLSYHSDAILKSTTKMQFQKTNGKLYATTNFGTTISSIEFTGVSGSFKVSTGTKQLATNGSNAQTISTDTVVKFTETDQPYFYIINAKSGASYCTGIIITYR